MGGGKVMVVVMIHTEVRVDMVLVEGMVVLVLLEAVALLVLFSILPLEIKACIHTGTDVYLGLIKRKVAESVRLCIWKMPKLWVWFLKCVLQTHPRSFPVLFYLYSSLRLL